MKQLQIEIKDNYKIWGVYDVSRINWSNGGINYINVDFYRDETKDQMTMYNLNNDGIFKNMGGNLRGTLIY